MIAPRPVEAGREFQLDWIAAVQEYDRVVAVAAFAASADYAPPAATMTATCRRTSSVADPGSRS